MPSVDYDQWDAAQYLDDETETGLPQLWDRLTVSPEVGVPDEIDPAALSYRAPDDVPQYLFDGRPVSAARIRDVAEQFNTTPEAILRLGSSAGQLEARFGSTPAGQTLMRAEQGVSNLAGAGLSLLSRAGILPDYVSDNIHAEQKQREEFLQLIEQQGDVRAVLGETGARIYNNATTSLAQIGVAAPAGAVALYSSIGASTYDQSLQEAEDSGITGASAISFAAGKTAVELGVTALMGRVAGKFGAATPEEAFTPGLVNASRKVAQRIYSGAAGVASEATEEAIVSASQQGLDLLYGTRDKFNWQEVLEAGATGALAGGFVGAASEAARADSDLQDTVSGFRTGGSPAPMDPAKRNQYAKALEEGFAKSEQFINETVEGTLAAEAALKATMPATADEILTKKQALAQFQAKQAEAGPAGRGARQAKSLIEQASPEILDELAGGVSAKRFHEITGTKKTSKAFRDAFSETLALYRKVSPRPANAPATETQTGVASPVEAATPQTAPQGPVEGTPPVEGEVVPEEVRPAVDNPEQVVEVLGSNPARDNAGESGALQVDPSGIAQAVITAREYLGWAKDALKENFTTRGLSNDAIFQAREVQRAFVAGELKESAGIFRELDLAVQDEYGSYNNQIQAEIGKAMRGQPSTLKPKVAAAVNQARAQIDRISDLAKEQLPVDSDIAITIEGNMGSYITRAYRRNTDRNWVQQVKKMPDVLRDARAELRSIFPKETDAKIEWRLNTIIDPVNAGVAPDGSNSGAFTGILKARKNIPEAIRKLMGEYEDPVTNYLQSVSKLVQLVGQTQFSQDVLARGLAEGFFYHPNQKGVVPNPELSRKIDGKANPMLKMFDGVYTTPTLARALEGTFSGLGQGALAKYMYGLYASAEKATGTVKGFQTVGNSKSYLRNFLGNTMFAMRNGDLFNRHTIANLPEAIRATYANVRDQGDSPMRDYLKRLAQLELVENDVTINELDEMVGTFGTDNQTLDRAGRTWGQAVKQGWKNAGTVYRAMDSVWKILAFENKKVEYTKILDEARVRQANGATDLSPTELALLQADPNSPADVFKRIEEIAAEDVKQHYPTYNRIAPAWRLLSKSPIYGGFVSFQAETYRNLRNNIVTTAKHANSANKAERAMAHHKMAGTVASFAVIPALAQISKVLAGIDDDEEKQLRRFMPSWSRNGALFHMGSNGEGEYDVFDLSFMDPTSSIYKTVVAAMRAGEDPDVSFMEAFQEATGVLGGQELFLPTLGEVIFNSQLDGSGPVYNPETSEREKAWQIMGHLSQVMLPGTVNQLERVRKGWAGEYSKSGRPYDFLMEVAATFGARTTNVDVNTAIEFKAASYGFKFGNTDKAIRQRFNSRGSEHPANLYRTYVEQTDRRAKLFREFHKDAMAAVQLGVPIETVAQRIQETVSKAEADYVWANKATPYLPGQDVLEEIYLKPNGPERLQMLLNLYEESVDKLENNDGVSP